MARSRDDGATWTAPVAPNTNAATDSGQDRYPQVTTDGLGAWVAVWDSQDSLGDTIGTDWDILLARSTDDGATWTEPAALNTNAATDSGHDTIPRVGTDGAGNWVAVWYSDENLGGMGVDNDIFFARSDDDGANWSAPAALNSNAASDTGSDADPRVRADANGNWVVVWHSDDDLGATVGSDSDILVARSSDDGANWTTVAALNTNATTDTAANWDAPVKTSADMTTTCANDRPAASASTPKVTPTIPTAAARTNPSRRCVLTGRGP